jgi:hypothetical protein
MSIWQLYSDTRRYFHNGAICRKMLELSTERMHNFVGFGVLAAAVITLRVAVEIQLTFQRIISRPSVEE